MATVTDLTDRVAPFLLPPRSGRDVCHDCFNFTRGYRRCFACASGEQHLAAVVPISYSVGDGHLHRTLADYKRRDGLIAERATRELASVLSRFLQRHEGCVAAAAGVARFELVATVPSGDRERDERHPLRRIVGELVGPTHGRYERVLRRTDHLAAPRRFDGQRYESCRRLDGARVLLIDDTWTTGASAQSAAAALHAAGAQTVAAVVVGRYLNPRWHENSRRVAELDGCFDWDRCVICAVSGEVRAAA